MNILEQHISELTSLIKTNQHVKDKIIAQKAWDKYLKILRFYGMLDKDQKLFVDKSKRVLLGNRKWI